MTNNGFIKLPRNLLGWRWYANNNTRLVYFDLLLRAEWTDRDYLGVTLHRGQTAVTLPALAAGNSLSIQQVRTALNNLKSTGDITVAATSKFSIITLNFYDELQGVNKPNNPPTASADAQNQQTLSHENNSPTYYNKKKEENNARKRTLVAASGTSAFSKKYNFSSESSSFDINEVVARLKKQNLTS